jgi:TRAP-type mannitol/chloroaromatic compound transport system permease small subunit
MSWRALALLLRYLEVDAQKSGGVVHFPLWPFAAILLLGLVLLTIVFIMLFIREIVYRTGKIPGNLQMGR